MKGRTVALLGALLVAAVAGVALWAWLNPFATTRAVYSAPRLPAAEMTAAADVPARLAGDDDATLALDISRARYVSSPVVALAAPGHLEAAGEALEGRRVPVLLLPSDAGAEHLDALRTEIRRLGATTVVAIGVEPPADLGLASVPATQLKRPAGEVAPTFALVGDEETRGLVDALLRPAGGQALVVAEDPRGSVDAVAALAEGEPVILTVGDLATDADFQWKLETVLTGVELPGGGQLVAPGKLYVALYGHPGSSALGVLGEQGVEQTIERARQHAEPYRQLTDLTVVPSLEIIATIASAGPGPDGNYSAETPIEKLRPLVDAAAENGLYVVLDLQPGRTDFLTQAKMYEELLALPHVGLALDPEWRLRPDQVHLRQIGSVGIDEVNSVVTWLADFTRERRLPQKVLILHSFRVDMVRDIDRLDTSRDELAITMHVDGQGGQGAKQDTWRVLHAYAPNMPFWGWKNFYDEDSPAMLTPQQTIATVNPTPIFISYQ